MCLIDTIFNEKILDDLLTSIYTASFNRDYNGSVKFVIDNFSRFEDISKELIVKKLIELDILTDKELLKEYRIRAKILSIKIGIKLKLNKYEIEDLSQLKIYTLKSLWNVCYNL